MEQQFAYVGNQTVGSMVERGLRAMGYGKAESVAEASVVVSYCASQTALEDAYFDEGGLIQAARPGTLIIDLSPSTPGFARELNAVAVVNDLVLVEAPLVVVDGARPDALADKENIACFVAGEEEALAAARPVLEALMASVQDAGGPGAAQLARAAYTLQMTAQIVSAIEADALYRAFCSSASSFGDDTGRAGALTPAAEHMLEAVRSGRFDGDYTVEMFMAELTAALMAADDCDLILPQAEACMHLLELLAVIGGADKAPSALALVYGEEAACAEQGLDWTRAEQAYGEGLYDDDEGCDCGHDHSHGGYPDFPGYGAFSSN